LDVLSDINESVKVLPTILEFVDIAGLVEGAHKGEGLGNQFLANIRECDALIHVVRTFEDGDVLHVESSVEPVRDAMVIESELALADLQQVEKRLERLGKSGKSLRAEEKKHLELERSALNKISRWLEDGSPLYLRTEAREGASDDDILTQEEQDAVKHLHLLGLKRMIYLANVHDVELCDDAAAGDGSPMGELIEHAQERGSVVVKASAKFESELLEIECPEERGEFVRMVYQIDDDVSGDSAGGEGSTLLLAIEGDRKGLRALVKESYKLLDLRTFFTSGPTETRAWTIPAGTLAPQAAGVIHTDFEKGFIRADTIAYQGRACRAGLNPVH
jgi:GTP-binding protein YchF